MVSFQTLDLLYSLCKSHGQVEKHVTLVSRGSCASEVADMPCRGASPIEYDISREEKTTEAIKPPEVRIISNCKCQRLTYLVARYRSSYPGER
jgi:hypothetical protein